MGRIGIYIWHTRAACFASFCFVVFSPARDQSLRSLRSRHVLSPGGGRLGRLRGGGGLRRLRRRPRAAGGALLRRGGRRVVGLGGGQPGRAACSKMGLVGSKGEGVDTLSRKVLVGSTDEFLLLQNAEPPNGFPFPSRMTEQVVEGTGVGQGTHTVGLHLLFFWELASHFDQLQ